MANPGYAQLSLVFFLFGIFCAYWAQTTTRSALLWFVAGWWLAPIAGLVLPGKNGREQVKKGAIEP